MKVLLFALLVAGAAGECLWGTRECGNGECIDYRYWCDGGDPDCSDGSDEADCSTCDEGFVHCDSADICLPQPYVCDGWEDCPGAEDEADCSTPAPGMCNEGEFECNDGQCVLNMFKCDAWDDCLDGYEDEENCEECNHGFHCAEGMCIPPEFVCDDEEDCHRGEDESNTEAGCVCNPGDFECSNGDCIDPTWRCDGYPDCFMGSDEADCPTTPAPRVKGGQAQFLQKIKNKMAKEGRRYKKQKKN